MKTFSQMLQEFPHDDKLDNLRHAKALSSKRKRQLSVPLVHFSGFDYDIWQSQNPPSNSSLETFNELKYLQSLQQQRDGVVEDMIKQDKDVLGVFKRYLDEHMLEVDMQRVKEVFEESGTVILSLKRFYDRPRPKKLASRLGIKLTEFQLKTSETPSYPSGHATQGRLISKLIADEVPLEHRANILDLGERVGYNRQVAGAHYKSDTVFGHRLAEELYRMVKLDHEVTESLEEAIDHIFEALEYDGKNEDKFAVDLVSEIDDKIGSVDGEISRDTRSGKNSGSRIGVQIVMPADKRIAFTAQANSVIDQDPDLEKRKPAASRSTKDFMFRHKDMNKDVYVNTRPSGARGGGALADPNELMTAALCTLSKIPVPETIEELDALIEDVKKIVKSGKVTGHTSAEIDALENNYSNLCQAVSAALVVQKNGGAGADKVYLTGKAWDNDVKQFQVTKYGMNDFNASDYIIKKGKNYIGISLKKKRSATTTDPTLINKSFSTMIKGKDFDKVREELDVATGEFYVKLVKTAFIFQRRQPKKAVDKDGNPWLDDTMIKELGRNATGINTKNWKNFVQRIPNEVVNYQLKKSFSLFKPIKDIIIKNSDLFGNQLLQLILKTDLKDLQKVNFDFALVTGIGRYLPTQGPVIEEGDYKSVDIMATKLDDLFKTGKVRMTLDKRKTQAYEKGSTAAMLFFQLYVGKTPICDITMRYKGNFRAAPNFLAQITPEFKKILK